MTSPRVVRKDDIRRVSAEHLPSSGDKRFRCFDRSKGPTDTALISARNRSAAQWNSTRVYNTILFPHRTGRLALAQGLSTGAGRGN